MIEQYVGNEPSARRNQWFDYRAKCVDVRIQNEVRIPNTTHTADK